MKRSQCAFLAGTQTCSNGVWSTCARTQNPTAEKCGNGIDEDCDGADLACNDAGCVSGKCPDRGPDRGPTRKDAAAGPGGVGADGGTAAGSALGGGCGCESHPGGAGPLDAVLAGALALLLWSRSRRRRQL
jgi:MYXO-CTERM domain-containing protein